MPDAGENLAKGVRVQLDGLQGRADLNGQHGTILSELNEQTGRYNVLVDDQREALALKPEVLAAVAAFEGLALGSRVRIGGLQSKVELGGKLGTIEGFYGDRATVKVDDVSDYAKIKPANLVIAEEAPAPAAAAAVDERKLRVECNGVVLKLTLSAKQMSKPFADAVLAPFLKAYSKKKGLEPPVQVEQVAQVTMDSDDQTSLKVLHDIRLYDVHHHLKGAKGDVEFEIFLQGSSQVQMEWKRKGAAAAASGAAPPPPPPKETPPPPPPKDESDDDRAPPPTARAKFDEGEFVQIHGLTSEAGKALNGLQGRIGTYHADKERFDVIIDGQERTVSAKPANLRRTLT